MITHTFLGETLSDEQFKALSWLAFYIADEKTNPNKDIYNVWKRTGQIQGIENICLNVLKVPHDISYQIIHLGKIKGLINYNRFSCVVYYETDLVMN